MLNILQGLGHFTLHLLSRFGAAGILLWRTIVHRPNFKNNLPEFVQMLFVEGVLSLAIIIVSGVFIGMVIALQGFNILNKFAAAQQLGQLVALSVSRELGPVVTGLLFAGRAGSAMTAEIGLMKATDQLASMEMMSVDPIHRVLSPRFWAGFVSMPLLMLVFSACAIYGAYLVGVQWINLDSGSFWSNMKASVNFRTDILNGIIKSLYFGFAVAWIAIYQGFSCIPTAEGISRATTRTVVFSSLTILGLDFVLTAMMMGGW
jgi:phospholipid/cholesterol/gamma-HCH transport system permease protein